MARWPGRRRPRELFGPLAKWGHPLEHHHQTYTHRQLDRAVGLLEQIRDRLPPPPPVDPERLAELDDARWCFIHRQLAGECRPLHVPDDERTPSP